MAHREESATSGKLHKVCDPQLRRPFTLGLEDEDYPEIVQQTLIQSKLHR
jgi:hypothetical protein